mgnify:CR=1 FL=1
MGQTIILLFACLFSSQIVNASWRDTTKQRFKAVEVLDSNPFMGETFYRVFHVGTYTMYQSQYHVDTTFSQAQFDSATNETTFNVQLGSGLRKNRYFVFHRDSSFGYMYDPSAHEGNNLYLPVDSMLKTLRGTNNFELLITKKPDTTTWGADRTELKEVYVTKTTTDTPGACLAFHYSSRLNHLQESLNHVMDSAKKMKLFKIEYGQDEFYVQKEGRVWPAFKILTEIREVTVDNTDEIISYINEYKKTVERKSNLGVQKSSSVKDD